MDITLFKLFVAESSGMLYEILVERIKENFIINIKIEIRF
jgi:hypothetical protein